MTTQRKIIHVDMDAFFAAVEQRDFPEYQGKPLIVGGQPNSRGVVAACSYEARKFGIRSAMACSQAFRLCPEAIFVKPRLESYRKVSKKIREVFWRYGSQVEPLSLDEAYIDVTYTESCGSSATHIAQNIKREIFEETGLIASAGVSYNKFLAKVASDMDKPNGLYVIRPEQGEAFVATLPVGKFFGVGPSTELKMHGMGIYTGNDLKSYTEAELQVKFGKSAHYYYQVARGIDHSPVRSSRKRKSLGKETTFEHDVVDIEALKGHMNALGEKVFDRLEQEKCLAKTLTLKVKYADFSQRTRSFTQSEVIDSFRDYQRILTTLLEQVDVRYKPVRLLGVTASSLIDKDSDAVRLSHMQLKLPL
ncbi:MAG: DNA polymerase IV [Mariprofundaceae bacterium]